MKKTAMNMSKRQLVNLIKTANNDTTATANNTIKQLNSAVSAESVYPLTVTGFDGLDTAVSYINLLITDLGLKIYRPKKGGFVGKENRKRIIEFYLCEDGRVHIYTAPDRIQTIIDGKYKGIKTINDKWSISNTRYEMSPSEFYRLAYDTLYDGFKF